MTIFASNGSKIYIGAAKAAGANLSESDFSSETWTQINSVESLGGFGDTSNEVTFTDLSAERVTRVKGARDAGTMEVVAGIDYADAGQLALVAAEKVKEDYAFKIEFNDAPSGGTPSTRYFVAAVGSVSEAIDTADNIMKLNASLWINSNVVRVAAAPGV